MLCGRRHVAWRPSTISYMSRVRAPLQRALLKVALERPGDPVLALSESLRKGGAPTRKVHE